MKKALLITLCAMLFCLSGCGSKLPDAAVDGTPWSKDWITIGQTLGVEKPGHGLTLRDQKGAKNMFYTGWSIGEGRVCVNVSGEETTVYDAQLTLLLVSAGTGEEAQLGVEDWLALAQERYMVSDTASETFNGQEYTVLTYRFDPDASAFSQGVSAFAVFDSWAVSAELVCQESFEEDPRQLLADVLNHCHYAAG